MSLVEALAACALLGTLLVAIVLAAGRLTVQSAVAERRREACGVLDRLMHQWYRDSGTPPIDETGEVQGLSGWRWQTRAVAAPQTSESIRVLTVDVFAPSLPAGSPAASVQVVLGGAPGVEVTP